MSRWFFSLLLSLLFIPPSFLSAQTTESLEFEGPENAPIYVIEGDFSQSFSQDGMNYSVDWSMTMSPATGVLSGVGSFDIDGNFYYYGWQSISFTGNVAVDLAAKQAGSVVRVNGKMALSGSGSIAGYAVNSLIIRYTYTNVDIDPNLGQMSGYISATGRASVPGYGSFPVNVPKTYLSQALPDVDSDGQWDSTGDWTAEIDATVNGKGKIHGTGELAVFDENGEAYDLIAQKVTGSEKNGTVSLAATGNSPTTSKIKVNLTYLQADDTTVPTKSAVSAYGQNRKF
jgi:hypothetical protein